MGDGQRVDRRTVVVGAAGAAAGVGLAGCAEYGSSSGSGRSGSAGAPGGSASEQSAGGGPAPALASTSDVPVGGGVVFAEEKVVVTQAKAGDFRAFSSVCTHQGCTVEEVQGGTINCPCHGSRFRLDGTVAKGPARSPLPGREISVQGQDIRLA